MSTSLGFDRFIARTARSHGVIPPDSGMWEPAPRATGPAGPPQQGGSASARQARIGAQP